MTNFFSFSLLFFPSRVPQVTHKKLESISEIDALVTCQIWAPLETSASSFGILSQQAKDMVCLFFIQLINIIREVSME